ncbi:MAG: class I SAM-dependent methyltransferase [Magnetococcales bacterium]|nr:class I SAM-dependent methyltransferase [Magnetococcales bacterium]MBF0148827.1 class I SAM-dependent methyltransferase [Magnetococcales bacterium]MBF0174153.1 class I SAM-dependent methyltransferase [Magnetococcales bacterium]MBF0346445.1 class I SAM-dependent methyltransferase [Magnetococcales bacterium]MBF0629838.1 class I SAM-dependent methyltransferase [Magnetococcales bacterium]
MNPGPRSQERFFRALPTFLPVAQLTHVHLVHQDPDHPSPLGALRSHGFTGCVVAARASITRNFSSHPKLNWVLHDHPTALQKADHVLLELPQGREAIRLAIQQSFDSMPPSGRLWVYGIREHGIRSLGKHYASAEVALIKGHMRLLAIDGSKEGVPQPLVAVPFHRLTHDGLTLASLPGVFSWREVDEGSLLLLEAMADRDPGEKVLDWGCGYGLLGVALARRWPQANVVLADDQVAAVRAARETVRCNDLEGRVAVVLEDGIGHGLSRSSFSTIVTNPPFHRGARKEHGPTLAFFKQVATILRPGGSLWFVVNHFLEHGRILHQCGFEVEKVIVNNRFAVCRAWKGRRSLGE